MPYSLSLFILYVSRVGDLHFPPEIGKGDALFSLLQGKNQKDFKVEQVEK